MEKIVIDNLTENSVSVKRQNVTTIDGVEYAVGLPTRESFINSIRGRADLQKKLDIKYVNAIFSVWGDAPTIVEDTELEEPMRY